MRAWTPDRVAEASTARLIASPRSSNGPERVVIDSREARPGALFVGVRGDHENGGRFAPDALEAGAWGVLTTPDHAPRSAAPGVVLVSDDPLLALQRLATAWRRELGAKVIGVTGSTGKTSTKDILLALLAPHRRTVASRANFNTEIGLPLELLAAPAETEIVVLEMAMRGAGQIAELAEIAEPDVGVIVNVGPVHLELLGSIEAIAAAKAELITGLKPGGTAIVPAGEQLLVPFLRADVQTVTFGERGDVAAADWKNNNLYKNSFSVDVRGHRVILEVPFEQAHLRRNLLAAVAAADAVGVEVSGRVDLVLSPGRGQRSELPGGVTLVDDCYNANPMSMRAALDDLASAPGRRVAVLGDMLELGPDERSYHVEIGSYAAQAGVDVLVTVGPLGAAMSDGFDGECYPVADAGEAAALVGELLQDGDVVLVKASRGVGLELVCEALSARAAA